MLGSGGLAGGSVVRSSARSPRVTWDGWVRLGKEENAKGHVGGEGVCGEEGRAKLESGE